MPSSTPASEAGEPIEERAAAEIHRASTRLVITVLFVVAALSTAAVWDLLFFLSRLAPTWTTGLLGGGVVVTYFVASATFRAARVLRAEANRA